MNTEEKTLGQIAMETRYPMDEWKPQADVTKGWWEDTARAVITEHEKRKAKERDDMNELLRPLPKAIDDPHGKLVDPPTVTIEGVEYREMPVGTARERGDFWYPDGRGDRNTPCERIGESTEAWEHDGWKLLRPIKQEEKPAPEASIIHMQLSGKWRLLEEGEKRQAGDLIVGYQNPDILLTPWRDDKDGANHWSTQAHSLGGSLAIRRISSYQDQRQSDAEPLAPVEQEGVAIQTLRQRVLQLEADYAREVGLQEQYYATIMKQKEEIRQLTDERDILANWKHQQLTVESWWHEIDKFVRNHPEGVLGQSVAGLALKWLKEWSQFKSAIKTFRTALK